MRDIPVFTTSNGAASLRLREVPYKGVAFITLQDTLNPAELLQECIDFCKVVGASRIYATGHDFLMNYPLYTAVWQMRRTREGLRQTDAALFPVTEKTVEKWRTIYNERMADVPNASIMTRDDGEKLLKTGNGYFIHRNGELLGIGSALGDAVETVIAVKPEAGEDVLLALCSALFSDSIVLEVASANIPAVKLYNRLGFVKTAERSRWYTVSK